MQTHAHTCAGVRGLTEGFLRHGAEAAPAPAAAEEVEEAGGWGGWEELPPLPEQPAAAGQQQEPPEEGAAAGGDAEPGGSGSDADDEAEPEAPLPGQAPCHTMWCNRPLGSLHTTHGLPFAHAP